MRVEAQTDTDVDFATQLAATCPRVTENWVDINGIPNQEGERVDVSWRDVLFLEKCPDLDAIRLRGIFTGFPEGTCLRI